MWKLFGIGENLYVYGTITSCCFGNMGLHFCVIAAICIFSSSLEKYRRRHLMCMELAIALLLLMDALAWGYRGYPGTVGFYMVRISNFIVFLLSVIILILYHSYVCSHLFAGVEWQKRVRC